MKVLILSLIAFFTWAAEGDLFSIPTGTTYRVKGVGYDCGEFFTPILNAPKQIAERGLNFYKLSADKDLNIFLIEVNYLGANSASCTLGLYFNRNRADKTFDLSEVKLLEVENILECQENREYIENKLAKTNYYSSKRGIRYIAFDIINEENDICENNNVRAIFDRRAAF